MLRSSIGPQNIAATPHSIETRIAEVGKQLGDTFQTVLAEIPGVPSRAVELATFLGLDKTLAIRLTGAIRKQDPLAICHSVPGPRGLRSFLAAAQENDTPNGLLNDAEQAVRAFERLVQNYGGSRSALNTIIGGLLPEVRDRIERRNKKAAYDAMCNLLGYRCDASFVACMIQPSSRGNSCDSVCFTGKVGLQHLTPRAARMVWAQKCQTPSWNEPVAGCNLDGDPITSGSDVPVIADFCTKPIPEFELHHHQGSVYVALAGDDIPSMSPTNLFLGSFTPCTFLRYRSAEVEQEFVSYTPAEPAKVSFVDVFLRDDVWPETKARLAIYRTGARGNLGYPEERPFDRIDLLESGAFLGRGTNRIHTSDVNHYPSMVRQVFDRVKWESERFRVFRVRIEYPLLHAQIMLGFDLPDSPR